MSGPTPTVPATTAQLVAAALLLRQQQAAIAGDLAQIEAKLIELGPGKYGGLELGHTLTVVAAAPSSAGTPSYKLKPEDEAAARKIAGAAFAQVFDRKVIYTPCDGFAAVAPKLLTPKRGGELVQLCLVPGKGFGGRTAFVKYS